MLKNKPLLSLGRREYAVLKFIGQHQPVKRGQIDKGLNLGGGQSFFNKLHLLGLISKVRDGQKVYYSLNENGEWFIQYIENSPKILERLL
tara:strand:- start:354 stop:623 length:270 start_codon:yes stop_codon:yes gene_type:complete